MDRTDFLERLRRATAGLEPVDHPGPAPAAGETDLAVLEKLFAAALDELAGDQRLVRCDDQEAVQEFLRQELAEVSPDAVRLQGEVAGGAGELEVGLSIAVGAAARSASVLLDLGHAEAGYASLLCLHSIVLLPRDRLRESTPDLLATPSLRGSSGYRVQVTGASRTADIEKTLVSPAHGPARLSIVLCPPGTVLPSRDELPLRS